ncbi:MAG: hypothetical protein ACJAUY_001749 [Cognaticolwellia sp.]|jgi:hypothetical protein
MIIKKEQYLMFFISIIASFPLFPPISQRYGYYINIISLVSRNIISLKLMFLLKNKEGG